MKSNINKKYIINIISQMGLFSKKKLSKCFAVFTFIRVGAHCIQQGTDKFNGPPVLVREGGRYGWQDLANND